MTKEVSIKLKGVAILLMLFLHLFNNLDCAMGCQNLLMIDGVPLTHILTRASSPVPFYIILSGYGLYLVQHKRKYDVVTKLKKLFLHYWISLCCLIPIGAIMFGIDKYPGTLSDVISNMTGYHTTWNATIWFLLPYALLTHAYFYNMFFHDFICSFKYPLLIYAVLIVVSYISAIAVDKINLK